MTKYQAHRFAVAPLMDWTDSRCRQFHRLITRRALLYTEMVTAPAIVHGDRERLLGFEPDEHPVALQIGGSDPVQLAEATRIGTSFGYDEINLNVGCPSDRVQSGRFGACLMAEPDLVADCVAAMKAATHLPVTVKCRIGVDDQDPDEALPRLTERLIAVGVDGLIVHARKAWLKGLSPKQNRSVPPLDYSIVRRLKAANPGLMIAINGGITDLDQAAILLEDDAAGPGLDGVMLGRAAYETPRVLTGVDRRIFGEAVADADPFEVVTRLEPIIARHLAGGGRLPGITRHILGLFNGYSGARAWRRILTVEASAPGAGIEVLRAALAAVTVPAAEALSA
jgi:tRNA-dihydrouridine synthase A